MKKITFIITLLIFSFSFQINASNNLFDLDYDLVNSELADLTELENYLTQNGVVSLSELTTSNNLILNKVNISNDLSLLSPSGMAFSLEDMEWGSFIWGFCCWPIGLFTVVLNDNKDTNHKISYLIGVGTAFLFGGGSRFFLRGWYY
ncbi:MAG: hypothetical protein M3Q58_12650 [Bacteroidota bacterium]|nr:hypothetical protein [Bacteroidota bacterium]